MRTDQPLQEKKCNRPLRVFLLGEIKNFPSRQASPLIQIPHRSPLTDECQTDCQEEYAGQKHDHKIPSHRKSKDAGILREQYDRGEKPDDRPKGKSDARPQQAVGTRNTPIRLPIKIWSPNRRIEDKGQPPTAHQTRNQGEDQKSFGLRAYSINKSPAGMPTKMDNFFQFIGPRSADQN